MGKLRLELSPDRRPISGADVLIYYDGPQLFWLPVSGRRLLAVGVPSGGRWPFLVVELSPAQAEAVVANELSLRAACLTAAGAWLLPDYDAEHLVLEPLERIPGEWLPGDVMLGIERA